MNDWSQGRREGNETGLRQQAKPGADTKPKYNQTQLKKKVINFLLLLFIISHDRKFHKPLTQRAFPLKGASLALPKPPHMTHNSDIDFLIRVILELPSE